MLCPFGLRHDDVTYTRIANFQALCAGLSARDAGTVTDGHCTVSLGHEYSFISRDGALRSAPTTWIHCVIIATAATILGPMRTIRAQRVDEFLYPPVTFPLFAGIARQQSLHCDFSSG